MTSTTVLRETNEMNCLRALRNSRALSRSELGRMLGLSRMTAGNAVRSLIERNLVIETDGRTSSGAAGRPGTSLRLNPKSSYFIGFDLSTSKVTGVLVDFTLQIVARSESSVQNSSDKDAVLYRFARVTTELLKKADLPMSRLSGVGIAVPGIVTNSGRVLSAPYLGWQDFDLQRLLRSQMKGRYALRVVNDVEAFANKVLAEVPEESLQDTLVILLAEGIGCCRIRNGRIDAGAHGFAGEAGHMILDLSSSAPRTFEMLAGARSLLTDRLLTSSVEEMLHAIVIGGRSKLVQAKLFRWGDALSKGLLNLIHILDPERMILGGPLARLYPLVEDRVNESIRTGLVHGFPIPGISVAALSADSAALGAASTMREAYFEIPFITSQG